MLRISRRYSHFVYGVIQSGLTCAIAAGVANVPFLEQGAFLSHWLRSGLMAWALMLPVVLFAAPGIRKLTHLLTREEPSEASSSISK
jgi:FtsH-binding integral membrane protein